jgi:dTDP-4-amino-4,6-dideoxygalactose transaminase
MIDRNIVKSFGYVSRMDNLKAAILNFRIRNLNKIISTRRKNAQLYKNFIKTNHVYIPEEKKNEFNTYHTFVIQVPKRDILKEYLKKNGIETSIHYPIPIHLQPASKKLGFKKGDFPKTEMQAKKILTLPINQHLTLKQIKFISKKINNFFN